MNPPSRALRTTLISLSILAILAAAGCVAVSSEETGSAQSAVMVCNQTTVKGMDVSHLDGTINWATAKGSGISFAFVKATEGTTFADPMFATNWAAMKTQGVVRGAYHFFHADVDPVAQATFFLQKVGPLQPGDLPLVLDLETTNGQTEATIAANAAKFLDAVKAATGRTPMVYVTPAFLSSYAPIGGNLLWIANWGVTCPDVPAPWKTNTFWQYSAKGAVPGVGAGTVDLDSFNGTLAQLQALGVDPTGAGDGGAGADGGPGASDDGGTASVDGGGTGTDAAPDGVGSGASQGGGCSVTPVTPRDGATTSGAAVALFALVAATARRRRRMPRT